MMFLLGSVLTLLQVPDASLQQALRAEVAEHRQEAAMALVVGDEETEAWLAREIDRGDPKRHRALTLAAAWMGTEGSFALLDQAAASGRRPDSDRAFALVLFGRFHPDAGLNPKQDWKRAASTYEKACLLVGLLGRESSWNPNDYRELLGRRPSPALVALLDLAEQRRGGTPALGASKERSGLQQSAYALGSVGSLAVPVNAETLGSLASWTSRRSWWFAARRIPKRTVESFEGAVVVGDDAASILALYEMEPAEVAQAFRSLDVKVAGAPEKSWLWGAVGDRGLPLPGPKESDWGPHVAAGLLRLSLVDLPLARRQAKAWAESAREQFAARGTFRDRWPAALVMALAAEGEDRDSLRKTIEAASGRERLQLTPAWKLLLHRGETLDEKKQLEVRRWSEELHAGRSGFLAYEGPHWAAYVLLGQTQAAEFRLELDPALPGFDLLPLDVAADDAFYLDLAALLLGPAYRWPEWTE